MRAIYLKELRQFFSSLTGYLAILVFLLSLGLFLWIFPDTSLLEYGYASLEPFFSIAPNILLFLVPAITMRSFSEEYQTGTIEILLTKPLSNTAILLGKYLAAVTLLFFSLLPTLTYVYSLWQLGNPAGNLDTGGTAGSYIGLMLLACVFAAIGIFTSSLTPNPIVAYLSGVFLCFFGFMAFDYLSRLNLFFGKWDYVVEQIGMQAHYLSMGRGVIDTRDLVYFFSLIALFLQLTSLNIRRRK